MAKPAAAAPPAPTASSTPGGKMMARASIIIGHGITLQALDGLSREIRLDLRGGINTYGYVGGNPIGITDPYGLAYQLTISGGVALIVPGTGEVLMWS